MLCYIPNHYVSFLLLFMIFSCNATKIHGFFNYWHCYVPFYWIHLIQPIKKKSLFPFVIWRWHKTWKRFNVSSLLNASYGRMAMFQKKKKKVISIQNDIETNTSYEMGKKWHSNSKYWIYFHRPLKTSI